MKPVTYAEEMRARLHGSSCARPRHSGVSLNGCTYYSPMQVIEYCPPQAPQTQRCMYCKSVGLSDSFGRCMGCGAPRTGVSL
jgi:hypothetical protein